MPELLDDLSDLAAQLERVKAFRATTWAQHFEQVDAFLASL